MNVFSVGCILLAAGAGEVKSFGVSLGCIGDINADGYDDYVVGAPGTPSAFSPLDPSVPIIDGRPLGASVSGVIVVVDGFSFAPLKTIHAKEPSVGFGETILCMPARAGRAEPIVLVGSPPWSNGTGQVEVFSASTGQRLFVIPSPLECRAFGRRLAVLSDSDKDFAEIAVSGCEPGERQATAGVVFAFRLHSGGAELVWKAVSPEDGVAFGESLCLLEAGGTTGEDSLFVGAPGLRSADKEGEKAGSVFRLSATDGAVMARTCGAQSGERFGASMTALGDLDGDGQRDLVVGCPEYDGQDKDGGRIVTISSNSLSMLESIELGTMHSGFQSSEGARFGYSLCSVRMEGREWLAVGAPWGNWNGSNEGWVGIMEAGRIDRGYARLRRFDMTGWGGDTNWTYERTGMSIVPSGRPYLSESAAIIFGAPDDVHSGGIELYATAIKSSVEGKWLAP